MRVRSICARASAVLSGGSSSDLSLDDLDRGAALSEQDHRTEGGIGGDARDQLEGARPHDHFLQREAFQPRLRQRARDALIHGFRGGGSTSAAPARLSTTPPTSDLWMTSRERIFSATGAAMRAAASPAAFASVTASVRANGMP